MKDKHRKNILLIISISIISFIIFHETGLLNTLNSIGVSFEYLAYLVTFSFILHSKKTSNEESRAIQEQLDGFERRNSELIDIEQTSNVSPEHFVEKSGILASINQLLRKQEEIRLFKEDEFFYIYAALILFMTSSVLQMLPNEAL